MLAAQCKAEVFLLSVVPNQPGIRVAEAVHPGALAAQEKTYDAVLREGVARLKQLGFSPVARQVSGEPALEVAAFAKEISADLVVVGHRRQSLAARWWSGASGAYLVDHISCSLLVGRMNLGEDIFAPVPLRRRS
jgi:nucleotide-binding universal stress UspA family protein